MKSIGEWFLSLPEEIRLKAVANTKPDRLFIKSCPNLNDAIWKAFVWEWSPEGHEYWKNVANEAKDREDK